MQGWLFTELGPRECIIYVKETNTNTWIKEESLSDSLHSFCWLWQYLILHSWGMASPMLTAWIWGYRFIAKPHLKTELDNSWTIWKDDQAEQEATANLLGPENLLALGHKGGGGGLAEWWPSRGCLSPSLFLWPQTGLPRLRGWYSQTERTQISGTPSTSKPLVSSTISESPIS